MEIKGIIKRCGEVKIRKCHIYKGAVVKGINGLIYRVMGVVEREELIYRCD